MLMPLWWLIFLVLMSTGQILPKGHLFVLFVLLHFLGSCSTGAIPGGIGRSQSMIAPVQSSVRRETTVDSAGGTSSSPIASNISWWHIVVAIGRGVTKSIMKHNTPHAGIIVVKGNPVRLLDCRGRFRQGRGNVGRVQCFVAQRFVARRGVNGRLIRPMIAVSSSGRWMKRRQVRRSRRSRTVLRAGFVAGVDLWSKIRTAPSPRSRSRAAARTPDQRWPRRT